MVFLGSSSSLPPFESEHELVQLATNVTKVI
jgi:hypothetical protein